MIFSCASPKNKYIAYACCVIFLFQVFKNAFIPRNLDQVIDHEREFLQKQSGEAVEVGWLLLLVGFVSPVCECSSAESLGFCRQHLVKRWYLELLTHSGTLSSMQTFVLSNFSNSSELYPGWKQSWQESYHSRYFVLTQTFWLQSGRCPKWLSICWKNNLIGVFMSWYGSEISQQLWWLFMLTFSRSYQVSWPWPVFCNISCHVLM